MRSALKRRSARSPPASAPTSRFSTPIRWRPPARPGAIFRSGASSSTANSGRWRNRRRSALAAKAKPDNAVGAPQKVDPPPTEHQSQVAKLAFSANGFSPKKSFRMRNSRPLISQRKDEYSRYWDGVIPLLIPLVIPLLIPLPSGSLMLIGNVRSSTRSTRQGRRPRVIEPFAAGCDARGFDADHLSDRIISTSGRRLATALTSLAGAQRDEVVNCAQKPTPPRLERGRLSRLNPAPGVKKPPAALAPSGGFAAPGAVLRVELVRSEEHTS